MQAAGLGAPARPGDSCLVRNIMRGYTTNEGREGGRLTASEWHRLHRSGFSVPCSCQQPPHSRPLTRCTAVQLSRSRSCWTPPPTSITGRHSVELGRCATAPCTAHNSLLLLLSRWLRTGPRPGRAPRRVRNICPPLHRPCPPCPSPALHSLPLPCSAPLPSPLRSSDLRPRTFPHHPARVPQHTAE